MANTARRTKSAEADFFTTKDGSRVRELMHPRRHGNRAQSLAEARINAGSETLLHRHRTVEELYYVLQGEGLMTAGTDQWEIGVGDTVLIPPGTPHKVKARGPEDLRILCMSSPAYTDEDTELLTP